MMASYGTFGETRRHRRRNAWWSVIRFLSALVAVLAVGVYAYQVGVSANETRVAQLEADLARTQHDNLGLHDRMASAAEQEAAAARRWRACGSALLLRFQAAKRPICSPRCGPN